MKCQIKNIMQKEIVKIKVGLISDNDLFIAEINGKYIQTEREYYHALSHSFRFPTLANNLPSMLDWIRDLMWLHKEKYCLIIYNYSLFMKNDNELRNMLIGLFEETIFPHWEYDVIHTVAGGYPKQFDVYLVD